MKIAVVSSNSKAEEVVRQLLLPWAVDFSVPDKADVVVTYKTLKNTGKETIVIPSETKEFHRWVKEKNLKTVDTQGKKLKVPATDILMLNLTPKTQHIYMKSSYSKIADNEPLLTQIDDSTFLLPIDIIKEYSLKLSWTLNPRISSVYRFLTSLPIPYNLVPSRLRDFFFSVGKVNNDHLYLDCLDLDALRYLLIGAFQEAKGKLLQKKSWKGHRYACLLTHDVDTQYGLRRALALKRMEERYDIPSAWFLPTKRYKLESEIILQLANYGEVGAHSTKHDGKLIRLSLKDIVQRLSEAKRILETIVGEDVVGFRAPLLQHNEKIILGLEEAGYSYDTSIPAWEPKHPSTMGPHGIGTVYPLNLYGIIEIPVSVPQDHQMIKILGLNVEQTVKNWLKITEAIKELGGICVFLIHPDYDLANHNNLNLYEELLNFLETDNDASKVNPAELVLNS